MQNMLLDAKAELGEIDCAYLAGLFDSCGVIMASIEKHTEKKFGYRVRLSIKIARKNKAILEEIQKLVRCGRLSVNHDKHEFIIKDQNEISDFIDIIYPYSKAKRRQFDIARKIANQTKNIVSLNDLRIIAQLADELSALNARSKSIRKNYASMIDCSVQ